MNEFISLLQGFGITLAIFIVTLLGAIPLGLLISLASRSKLKIVRYPIKAFIWVIRGTPLMLQIIAVFYLPSFMNLPVIDRLPSVMIAFIINYAAYFSEIFRSGIDSIPKGQSEAGFALGLTRSQVFSKIILKQSIKKIIPPMGNEIITLVKDTALAQVIAVVEIVYVANKLVAKTGALDALIYAGIFYLLFNGILTILISKTEKHFNYYKE